MMLHPSLRTTEAASEELLRAVESKGRTITYALPGSEELRYLDYMEANANVGGPSMRDILLRQNPTKVEVLEEFLHGTQNRLGIIDELGVQGAETHVKQFMLRHQRLLGICQEDASILQQMLGI
jgi:large repetitive protein